MQRSAFPAWAWIVGGVLLVLAVLFFFQTKDPMILIFGIMAAGMVIGITALVAILSGLSLGAKIRCRECQALSPEASRFCGSCGKPL